MASLQLNQLSGYVGEQLGVPGQSLVRRAAVSDKHAHGSGPSQSSPPNSRVEGQPLRIVRQVVQSRQEKEIKRLLKLHTAQPVLQTSCD